MTVLTESRIGSLWRRWDLHIHAPGTKLSNGFGGDDDAIWDRYIDALEVSPVQVFGITDYFSADTYFELLRRYPQRKPDSVKVFFPNIEFRLSESISADGSLPHIHIIFDNDPVKCGREKIERFLSELQTQTVDGEQVRPRCSDLKTAAQFAAATISLTDLTKALDDTFGDARPYRIAFPANNDGMRSTDNSQPRKVALADRIDRTSDIFFGTTRNVEYFLKENRYEDGKSEPKPVVSGSDCHSFDDLERLSGDVAGYPPTWIKADATFDGLKQISFEPKYRVFIGRQPDVMTRHEQDGTKFARALRIDQVSGYDERNGRWFKKVDIPLNPELTAIIGNKGSGKSAIVDIIGLLGESRQEDYFSFLTDDAKSKKFRQKGFADNFTGALEWATERKSTKRLSETCDTTKPEAVRYLPQNYFEQLTNEIEIEQFRREIEDVVFSHVDQTDKLGTSSFAELEETKTLQSKQEISELKRRLRELNNEIVRLEEQSTPAYKAQLRGQIAGKREELQALDKAKPKEVDKPDEQTPEQLALASDVERLGNELTALQAKGQAFVSKLADLKKSLQQATSIKEALYRIDTTITNNKSELKERVASLGLDIDRIITLTLDTTPVDDKIKELTHEIGTLETENEIAFTEETDFEQLATLPDLRAAYAFVAKQIEALKERLSTPQRRYQEYQERLAEWTTKRSAIAGAPGDARPDTLQWLEDSLRQVEGYVAATLRDKQESRRTITREIFESKSKVLGFYGDLKSSVEDRLKAVRAEGFEIEIDASFVIDREFRRQFLNHIDQRRKGPFRVDQDAQKWLGTLTLSTNWDDVDAVVGFCESICAHMTNFDPDVSIADQTNSAKEMYDHLFSLDYLSARYELRLAGKNLNELSPGEKGLLLLIFYLQLDLNDTPLVIDQPEDNLDNDSIFAVLAKCIRDAKKHRQVILVTHNPNLAVGADAEEIVYVKLDKPNAYRFSYETGSIENPKINARLLEVLEGSQPAFVKRRLKYGIN